MTHVTVVSDLIAAEGDYRLCCYVQFNRKTTKIKQESQDADIVMICFCDELKRSADQGLIVSSSSSSVIFEMGM